MAVDYSAKTQPETVSLGPWHKAAMKLFDFKEQRVLDVGCGTGAFLRAIQPSASAVLGLDPNPYNVDLATQGGGQAIRGCFGVDTAPECARFRPTVITCFEVIEHLYSPLEMFSLARRLLEDADGLAFVVSTPNAFHVGRAFDFVVNQRHRDPLLDPVRHGEPEHLRMYSGAMLRDGLLKTGFRSVGVFAGSVLGGRHVVFRNPLGARYFGQGLIAIALI